MPEHCRGPYDDAATSPSLEQLDDPAASGVPVLDKRLVVALGWVAGVPGKIEGIARGDRDTLALINDNDFGGLTARTRSTRRAG